MVAEKDNSDGGFLSPLYMPVPTVAADLLWY